MAESAGQARARTPAELSQLEEAVAGELCRSLRETAFSNQGLIAPRRLDAIGREEAALLVSFVETENEDAVRQQGRHLAQQGLGHRSILAATETVRSVCREKLDGDKRLAGRYACALLEGYMAGREEALLREQERTREAFLNARERQDQS